MKADNQLGQTLLAGVGVISGSAIGGSAGLIAGPIGLIVCALPGAFLGALVGGAVGNKIGRDVDTRLEDTAKDNVGDERLAHDLRPGKMHDQEHDDPYKVRHVTIIRCDSAKKGNPLSNQSLPDMQE